MLNALASMPTPTGPLCLDSDEADRLRARRLSPVRARAAAARAAALADPTRLEIATSLASAPELCVADLAWLSGRAQNLVSHHLRTLRSQGLVRVRRSGKLAFYALTDEGRALLRAVLAAPRGA
jgi:DNA-binding transcriptional ArsR family regulator